MSLKLNELIVTNTIAGSVTGNAATATNVAWSGITSKPTTLSGFGITDAASINGASNQNFSAYSIYPYEWIRFMVDAGIYWQSGTYAGWHIHPQATWGMSFRSNAATDCGLQLRRSDATSLGAVYADGTSIGFLTAAFGWGASFTVAGTMNRGTVPLGRIETITAYTILGNNNASAAAVPSALTPAQVATMLSGQTMNIAGSSTSCTGNAATATSADNIDGRPFVNTNSNSATNADSINSNGISYYGGGVTNFSGNATDGGLYSQAYSNDWQHQIAGDYRSGQIALRGKNSGTWQSWRRVLDDTNSPYALNMNQYVRTTDSPTFAGLNGNANSATFYANNASYGSWRIGGTRNGWYGIEFESGTNLMANSNEVGFHRNGHGWQFWWSAGTGYVHKGNPGGGTQATILDSSNAAYAWNMNQYVRTTDSPTFNTVTANITGNAYNNLSNDYKDIYVYGDVNTYYVVLIQGEYLYSFGRYSVTRGYNWTGPDTWNIATHKGGLTLDWEWSGDTAWGGNDKAIRIIEFNESYSTMVAGLGYPVNGGVIIWLRGGGVNGAQYRIRTPNGSNSVVTVYDNLSIANHVASTTFTAADSTVFSTRANTNNVSAEILARYPVRATGGLFDGNNAVLHAGNYNSYSPTLTGTGASGTWGISVTGNAVTAGGLAVHGGRNNEANKIVRTDSNGYIQAGWINTTSGDMPDTESINKIYCSSDDYVRYKGVADFKQQIGLTYKNATPRSSNTTDTNYWTGVMGWGTTDLNDVATWGSGFFDTWSSPGNGPGTTSHYVGLQAFHYSGGANNAYGFQMVSSTNANRFHLRSAWPTWQGWVEMLTSGNYNSFAPTLTGTGASGTWAINVTGNAATATTLQTARNINGTSFNGSAAITTATWGTARTLTIGSTGKSVDGSAAVSWSLAEIGAAATNQTMFIGTTSVAINRASSAITLTGTSIDGNAATATSATSATYLNSSNYIQRIGSSGNYNTDFQNTPAGSVRHQGDDYSQTNCPGGSGWWFVDNYRHSNASNYWGTQVAWGWEDQANKLATRNITGGTFGSWIYYLNSNNYTDYTVTKTGTGASGTWGINITGNAATATTATNVTIANGSVTLAKIENITAYTILGNSNASAAATPAALSVATVATMLSGQTMNINGSSTSCSGNAATATLATKASTLSQGGGNGTGMTFNWSGQGGQPTWLWGSNDGTNIYVWNPSNFNVNYATSAGSATSATTAGSCSGNAATATNVAASGITGQTGMWTSAVRPGPYRLYRNDDNSAYNVQLTWQAHRTNYWSLRGYLNDTFHAECFVVYSGYADTAGALTTTSNYQVANLGIGVAASNKLHISGDGTNPPIRIDNPALGSGTSSSRGFYGWLPISIGGVGTKYIQLYN